MPGVKLSAKSQETVDYLESVMRECDHFASLVEQFAGAKSNPDQYSSLLGRELGHLRQKAMMRNLGFIADTAGQLSVAAGRAGSPIMKSRMLRDGVASLKALVERTIKATIQEDASEKKEKEFQEAKARKTQAEAVKARVIAEEAKEAAKQGAVAAPQPAAGAPPAPKPAAPPGAAQPRPAQAPAAAPPPRPAAPAPKSGAAAAPAPTAPRAPGTAGPAGPSTVKP